MNIAHRCSLKSLITILLAFCCLQRQVCVIFVFSFKCKNEQKPFLNQVQRAEIITLYKKGYSERKISAKCYVSKTAIHTAIVNWRLRRNYSDLKRSRRPKKTTVKDNLLIKRMVVRSPTSSITQHLVKARAMHNAASFIIEMRLHYGCNNTSV